MSDPLAMLCPITKGNPMSLQEYAKTQLICAFCDNLLPANAEWCESCQEYKGVMTLCDYENAFGTEW